MTRQNIISVGLTVVIASAAIIGSTYALKGYFSPALSAEETVLAFYSDWTEYEGNPIADRIYRESAYADAGFVAKTDALIDSFDKGGFDPVLCAQDFPSELKIANAAIKGGQAVVAIEEVFSGNSRMIEARLSKPGKHWLITDIICHEGQAGENGLNAGISPAVQNQVGDYIRENISRLSPEDAVLGGTFQVTSIRFTGPYTCVVDYEDGHIALTADVRFRLPAAGQVEIESFRVRKDGTSANFNETGNLSKSGDAWTLVYEKPGQPALTAKLNFTEESFCADAYADKSCSPAYWQIGDRAEISGYLEEGELTVFNLRVVGEASREISGNIPPADRPVSNFEECVAAGNEAMYPDCAGCAPYCETPDGNRFKERTEQNGSFCEDACGNGSCGEVVCQAQGCPCAETPSTCPADCQ